jgi:16S rRNA processing protein RimM
MNSNIDESTKLIVAYIGKTIGLKGQLKLRPQTDFLNQFKEGVKLEAGDLTLEIESFDKARLLIKFVGYDTIDDARRLSTMPLSATIEQSRKNCELGTDEYFWFDIIGATIIENNETLGKVEDIERFPGGDYLSIITDETLVKRQFPKSFLIPYNDRYIVNFDTKTKTITTRGSKDILEAS